MLIDTYAHEEPHASFSLERESQHGESELELTELALSATEALCAEWLEPLAWELYIACRDEDFYTRHDCLPPRAHCLLRKTGIDPGIRLDTLYPADTIDAAPELLPERMRAWMHNALLQQCPGAPRNTPAWAALWSRALQVKLPKALSVAGRHRLQVDCHAGPVSVPVVHSGDEVWVSGPREDRFLSPPVAVSLRNQGGFVTLSLQVYWDLWITEPAGRAMVDAAVERVLALGRGWQRCVS